MGTDKNTDLDYQPLQPTSTTNLYNQISWPALVKTAFAVSAVTPPRVSASAMDALAVYTIVTSAPKRNEPTEPTHRFGRRLAPSSTDCSGVQLLHTLQFEKGMILQHD